MKSALALSLAAILVLFLAGTAAATLCAQCAGSMAPSQLFHVSVTVSPAPIVRPMPAGTASRSH